eukprot:Pgem_evm1s10576
MVGWATNNNIKLDNSSVGSIKDMCAVCLECRPERHGKVVKLGQVERSEDPLKMMARDALYMKFRTPNKLKCDKHSRMWLVIAR